MRDVNASVYIRVPFTLNAPPDYDSLQLTRRYLDGLVVYLNGVEVARRNAPEILDDRSAALTARPRSEAFQEETLDLPGAAALLGLGTNILAIHGLNDSSTSPEFLLAPQLTPLRLGDAKYLPEPTPGTANAPGVSGFVEPTASSVSRGIFPAAFDVQLTCPTPGATLVYTTNGSPPSATNGVAVGAESAPSPVASIHISGTTILRVSAVKAGYAPAPVATHTYLFPADLARQPANPSGLPAADYEVDPDVINTTRPGYGFDAALRAIPVVSITTSRDDMFGPTRGIYINSEQRGDAWERSASVEFFSADGRDDYQVDCGVRIHGNISRQNGFTPKHSFGLFFRGRYGSPSFRHPLFAGSSVDQFDTLILKGLSTDTWPCVEWGPTGEGILRWQRVQASYVRDQWVRDAQLAMGQGSANGRFVHVVLNGLYWGLYNLTEHPDAAFQAAHYGGTEEDYDALKDYSELDSGTADAWNQAQAMAAAGLASDTAYQRWQGNNPDGSRNPAYPVLVNVDSLIDYMILHILIGADDWPYHNWWAARRRGDQSEGFRFFAWDQEISNNSLLKSQTAAGVRYELVSDPGTPAALYSQARANANFRLHFADRVQLHLFNDGALGAVANDARWRARTTEIDQAIVAESARWGDAQRAVPYKREIEWLAHEAWMHTNFWPNLPPVALQRFRNVGLYPSLGPPAMNQPGGSIDPGFALILTHTNNAGNIFFTLDGSDPRLSDGSISPGALAFGLPVTISETTRVRARVRSGPDWSALTEAIFRTPQDLRPLRLTEVTYHPAAMGTDHPDEFEFLESNNTGTQILDLGGIHFTAGITFTFIDGSRIGPGQFLVLARNPALFGIRYPGVPLHGADLGKLDNGGELLRLTHPSGATILEVNYSDQAPWPLTADGAGFSLFRAIRMARLIPNSPGVWRASGQVGGSPGRDDAPRPFPTWSSTKCSPAPFCHRWMRSNSEFPARQTQT